MCELSTDLYISEANPIALICSFACRTKMIQRDEILFIHIRESLFGQLTMDLSLQLVLMVPALIEVVAFEGEIMISLSLSLSAS